MALNKDEHYEEKWVGRKLLYRLHPAFDWREMPYDELCNKICDLENELKRVRAKTSEREQANENIPLVSVNERSEVSVCKLEKCKYNYKSTDTFACKYLRKCEFAN